MGVLAGRTIAKVSFLMRWRTFQRRLFCCHQEVKRHKPTIERRNRMQNVCRSPGRFAGLLLMASLAGRVLASDLARDQDLKNVLGMCTRACKSQGGDSCPKSVPCREGSETCWIDVTVWKHDKAVKAANSACCDYENPTSECCPGEKPWSSICSRVQKGKCVGTTCTATVPSEYEYRSGRRVCKTVTCHDGIPDTPCSGAWN